MKHLKVVVTDWEFENLGYEEIVFEGLPITLIPAQAKTEDEVIEVCRDADGIINQYAPLPRKVIQALEQCKVIARYGVGVNTIDLEAATEKGICVCNVPDYCQDEVSDHAMALIMSLLRKIVVAHETTVHERWDFKALRPIRRFNQLTVGLVGFGHIPQTLAKKLQPFGCKVVAFDPYIPKEVADSFNVTLVELAELCQISDIVSVHAPLLESTRGMIGTEQFNLMKEDAVLVNTSRGPVVDEEALIKALETKKIGGAGLDVVVEEPISREHPLLKLPNVILTPHVAWYSEESEAEMRTKVAEGVASVLAKEEFPKYLVNKDVQEKVSLRSASSIH